MLLQKFCHGKRIFRMSRQTQMQRLKPLQEQERIERRNRRTKIAQQGYSCLDDIGDIAQRL